jgi:hypothetical protein
MIQKKFPAILVLKTSSRYKNDLKTSKKILIWNQEKNKIKINIFQKHF